MLQSTYPVDPAKKPRANPDKELSRSLVATYVLYTLLKKKKKEPSPSRTRIFKALI